MDSIRWNSNQRQKFVKNYEKKLLERVVCFLSFKNENSNPTKRSGVTEIQTELQKKTSQLMSSVGKGKYFCSPKFRDALIVGRHWNRNPIELSIQRRGKEFN